MDEINGVWSGKYAQEQVECKIAFPRNMLKDDLNEIERQLKLVRQAWQSQDFDGVERGLIDIGRLQNVAQLKFADWRSLAVAEAAALTLSFIVNGEEVEIRAERGQPIHLATRLALKKRHHTGRPWQDWELRTESGQAIDDQSQPVESLSSLRLFLTLKIGLGAG